MHNMPPPRPATTHQPPQGAQAPTGARPTNWKNVVYGGWLVMPLVSWILVRRRSIGYPTIIGLNLIPYLAQVLVLFLYIVVFDDVYGYICC